MSFIFIGHFISELINIQLQRIFTHLLRVWDPSLFPYHLKHLAWTFQVVYQTEMHLAASSDCCRGFLVPLYYNSTSSFELGTRRGKGRVPHGAPSRSLKLDCQVQVDVTPPALAAFSQWAFSPSVSSRSLRSPRLSSPSAGRSIASR